MSYYSIDAILADSQKVPCTFNLRVPGMAHLETSNHNPSTVELDIKENAKIDLPCWLAEVLYAPPGEYVEFEIPAPFRRVVLNALTASPTSVDLRSQSAQFYAFAEKIMNLLRDTPDSESQAQLETLSKILSNTYLRRAASIASHVSEAGSGTTDFLNGLEDSEREFWERIKDCRDGVRKWEERKR